MSQQLALPSAKYTLNDRLTLKEKVVSEYEMLWSRGDLPNFANLFALKVNAIWLQDHVGSCTAAELVQRQPAIRKLFAACCARLGEDHPADVQSHAMETLSGIFLGIGCRNFTNPISDVLELLCGLDEADAVFGALFGDIKRILTSPRRGAAHVALRRAAVRLLLALAASASDLQSNILVEFLMPKGFDAPLTVLLTQVADAEPPPPSATAAAADGSGSASSAAASAVATSAVEDAALLLVLLAAYRRHERPNGFLRVVTDATAEAPHLQALAQVSRKVFERCMYPAEAAAASSYLGASWGYSLARWAEWGAHLITMESYLPTSITSQLSSPEALRTNAAPLTVALLICYELAVPRGGATLAELCAQMDAVPAALGGGSARGALLRHLFSVASLLACDARDALLVAQLRLALLVIERVLDGAKSAPLLLSVDLGGGLPLWAFSSSHITDRQLPSPQPLLGGAYTLLAMLLTQNLRRASFHPPLYVQALTLLQRLMIAQHRAQTTLPLLKWEELWAALFTVADFISNDDVFTQRGAPEVGLRVLEVINVLVTLGDAILPSASHFESFAYELVRRHRTFEKLYRIARQQAPHLVKALSLARSLIVGALEAIGKMDLNAAANLTSSQALDIIRALQPSVKPEDRASLLRPPTQMAPHEQLALSQSLLRVLLAHCRRDGSLAPIHHEDCV